MFPYIDIYTLKCKSKSQTQFFFHDAHQPAHLFKCAQANQHCAKSRIYISKFKCKCQSKATQPICRSGQKKFCGVPKKHLLIFGKNFYLLIFVSFLFLENKLGNFLRFLNRNAIKPLLLQPNLMYDSSSTPNFQ